MYRIAPALAIATIATVGLAFSYHLGRVDVEQHTLAERVRVETELNAVRAQLDGQIKATFGVTQGIVDLITVKNGIDANLFADMVKLSMEKSLYIRDVGLAPNNIISDVFPREGNDKIIGTNYATMPHQYETIQRAKMLGEPVLSPPLTLIQGGRGIIQRAPVFIRKNAARDGTKRAYWGTVSVVAHIDPLLIDTGVTSSGTLDIAVLTTVDTQLASNVISGNAAVFTRSPVTLDLSVPGGVWRLAATPRDGWAVNKPYASPHFRFGLAITILLTLIASLLSTHANKLRARNLALTQEVRERQRAEEGLRLAAAVYKSTDQGIIVVDSNARIVSVNLAFTVITGFTPDEVIHQNFSRLQSMTEPQHNRSALWDSLIYSGSWQGELRCMRKSGEEFPCWATASAIDGRQSGEEVAYVIVISDISSLMRTQKQLEQLAHYDSLTGLPNRLLFQHKLTETIQQPLAEGTLTAVLLLDLDGFKAVNDSHGHPVGDKLLQQVAARLQSCVPASDVVARLGGDEFALILNAIPDKAAATTMAEKLLSVITQPFDHECAYTEISTSIGIAIYPLDSDNTINLIRDADTAMYSAKEHGRNNYRFYQASLTEAAQARLVLERALRKSLEQAELEVWYQPQISLHSGELTGAEALLRWRSSTLGAISPVEFIPVAERTGLIIPIGEFVLEQVCRDGKAWLDAGFAFGKLAVNVATPQIEHHNFVAALQSILQRSQFPAKHLEIEITESVIMASADDAQRTLNAIQTMGISTAIDDFGTGYSSLAYLKELPIDNLKIDRAFIKNLPAHSKDATITRTIISLAHSLGFRVIAEGIETEEQKAFLAAEACDEIQGYLVGRPMPAAEFTAWMKNYIQ